MTVFSFTLACLCDSTFYCNDRKGQMSGYLALIFLVSVLNYLLLWTQLVERREYPSVWNYLSHKLIKMDVSRTKIRLDTSISPTSISGRREQYFQSVLFPTSSQCSPNILLVLILASQLKGGFNQQLSDFVLKDCCYRFVCCYVRYSNF